MNSKILTAIFIALPLLSTGCSSDNELVASGGETTWTATGSITYPIVDTNESLFYNNTSTISTPAQGEAFYGQDAQYKGNTPSYQKNADGTVTDNVTGLTWTSSPDFNNDGVIDADDKMSISEAEEYLKVYNKGEYNDWRIPSIKELYSLIQFNGTDPSGFTDEDTSVLTPFINTNYFDFAYGDTNNNERIIDSQYLTTTGYVYQNLYRFGVNFADGRIKGYGLTLHGQDKTFFVIFVRGNESYGVNHFVANADSLTITDEATGLMWAKEDSENSMTWKDALAYAENSELGGYTDWRLPNVKELHSIVDYTRAPDVTDSPAIDAVFSSHTIINEAGQVDYPYIWSSTTHATYGADGSMTGGAASYVSFGRAMGQMPSEDGPNMGDGLLPPPPDGMIEMEETTTSGEWTDVHGAGAQRSDFKTNSEGIYNYTDDFSNGETLSNGPQGDAVRYVNHVRLVRTINK
ncbi:MAG: DUF1566 domain-containing protein [Bacteroidaceae bacterium]